MSTNTTPRDYVVTIRLQKLRQAPSETDPIERIPVTAYDWNEAAMQAIIGLDARIGGIEDHGYKSVILSVEPDCQKGAERTNSLLRDISLAIMDPQGTA